MDLLDRLHRRLIAAVPRVAADHHGVIEFSVADLYQQFIPYRAVRSEVGAMELAEYEHALLRLLSGERGYVELSDASVRAEIQRELASLNPILGIYRDYASAPARLLVRVVPHESPTAPASGSSPSAAADRPLRQVPRGPLPAPASPVPPTTAQSAAPVGGALPADSPDAVKCRRCRRALPLLDNILYCPYCGASQGPTPCDRCGTPIESAWKFCIRCGAARADALHD